MHYDNLAAAVKAKPAMGPLRSYCTVRRYMQAHGLLRQPRVRPKGRPGEVVAAERRENREVRSYEAEYVGSLWHLDFHHGSLQVLTSRGQWQRPIALAILDDHSRLCCHLQWYLSETAEDLVHGLSQAIQKRGLPRALLTDNGAAMVAEEVGEGLLRLGIVHEKTLPYSPYQNGKQEVFWATLEGRLMEMLDGCGKLSLDFLNEASQAWVEIDYHRAVHRETGLLPAGTFRRGPGRAPHESHRATPSATPSAWKASAASARATARSRWRACVSRSRPASATSRTSSVRYARWDLGRVDLVDPRNGTVLAPLYPQDRTANADARRCYVGPPADNVAAGHPPAEDGQTDKPLPPLLKKILEEYSATGLPPAYLPKNPPAEKGEAS